MKMCGLHNITVTAKSNYGFITILIPEKNSLDYTTLLLLRKVTMDSSPY